MLTEEEQELAKLIAKRRSESNRSNGVYNRRVSKMSDYEVDLEGIGAEIFFCKTFNLYPDLNVGHTPAFDAILPDGRTVDVKATKYKNGHLLAAPWKKKKQLPDVYCLVVGTFPEYRVAGWMSAEELLRDERMAVGKLNGYVASQEELAPPEQLE